MLILITDKLTSSPCLIPLALKLYDLYSFLSLLGHVSNGAPFNVNWETFDDDITSSDQSQSTADRPTPMPRKLLPEPAIPERADSPRHNSLGYALPFYKKPEEQATKRTPPPLPKPYASKNADRAGTYYKSKQLVAINVNENRIEQYFAVHIVHNCQQYYSVLLHLIQINSTLFFNIFSRLSQRPYFISRHPDKYGYFKLAARQIY